RFHCDGTFVGVSTLSEIEVAVGCRTRARRVEGVWFHRSLPGVTRHRRVDLAFFTRQWRIDFAPSTRRFVLETQARRSSSTGPWVRSPYSGLITRAMFAASPAAKHVLSALWLDCTCVPWVRPKGSLGGRSRFHG